MDPRSGTGRPTILPPGREGLALLALAAACAAGSVAIVSRPVFEKYPNLADALRTGRLTGAQVADASPAYLLLNLVAAPGVVRGLQALLAGLGVVLVHAITRRAAGRGAAWVAALLLAAAQPWLVYSGVVEPDLAIAFLGLASVACLALPGPRPPGWSSLGGAALGLSLALRPSVAPFALAALAWLVHDRRGNRPALHAFAFVAGFALAGFLPTAALQTLARQEWKATMSAGQVFHQGHRPEGSGLGANYPTLVALIGLHESAAAGHPPDVHHELYRKLAGAAQGRTVDASTAERYWASQVLHFARREPGAFARQLLRKAVFVVVAPPGDADIPDVHGLLQRVAWSGIPLGLITWAGLAGLLLSLRSPGVGRLLVLWVATYVAVFLVFYFQSRYAVTVLPPLCALAGMGAARLAAERHSPRRLALLALVAGIPILAMAPRFVRDERRILERTAAVPVRSEAVELRRQGRWEEARDRHVDEQAALPDWTWPWSPHGFGLQSDSPEQAARAADRARARWGAGTGADAYLLAVLEAAAGRCEDAIPLARSAAKAGFEGAIADTALDPGLLASDCLLELGRPDEALREVERSLERRPGTLDGLARATAAWEATATGRRPGSGPGPGARYREELHALHDPASAHYALSRALRRWGNPDGALAEADALVRILPDARPFAEFERALSLLDLGRPVEALQAYARSMSIRYPMHGSRRFDVLVRELQAGSPGNLDVARFALAHWSSRGELGEMRAILKDHPGLADVPASTR